MENVQKYKNLITMAINSPNKNRVKFLKSFKLNIIKTICEIFLNILSKNLEVPRPVLEKLVPHKRLLYKLVDIKIPLTEKKKALIRNKGKVLIPILNIIP